MIAPALLASALATAALRPGGGPGNLKHPAPGVYLFDADGNGKPDRFEVDWSPNRAKEGYNVDLTLLDDRGEVMLEDGFFIAEKEYAALFDLAAGERLPRPAAYFADFFSLPSGPNALEERELEPQEIEGLSTTCLGDPEPEAAAVARMRAGFGRDRHVILSYSRGTRDDGYTLVYARALDRLVCLPDADE